MYSITCHVGLVRKACETSVSELSTLSGLSESRISEIESEVSQPSLIELLSIADALEVPLNCLVTVRNEFGRKVYQWLY